MNRKWIRILSLFAAAVTLPSCSSGIPDPVMVCRSSNGAFDNGNVYYTTGSLNMQYYDTALNAVKFACEDPVCNHYNINCFSYLGGLGSTYLAAADGTVYTVVQNMSAETYGILAMDFTEQNKYYIVQDYPNSIGRFLVCEKGIYFCALDENGKQNICYADAKGKITVLTEEIPTHSVLLTIENGTVWFYDFDGNIYSADAAFENIHMEYHQNSGLTYGYYYTGGYLYYFDDPEYEEYVVGDRTIGNTGYTLYRVSMREEHAEPEIVCSSVYLASSMIFSETDIWVAASCFTIDGDHYTSSGGKLIHIDPVTLEKEEVLIENTDMGSLVYAGDDYICGFGKYMEDGKGYMGYIIYDRVNQKQYHVKG